MQILTRTECGRCDGTGVVTHPEWKKFWSEISRRDARGMDELQLAAFLDARRIRFLPKRKLATSAEELVGSNAGYVPRTFSAAWHLRSKGHRPLRPSRP